jgi:hypothetical protein
VDLELEDREIGTELARVERRPLRRDGHEAMVLPALARPK